ncbi:MAG: DUF72 domain-containing protein [Thaumarchaeota archaeon]|nr:MAG: DUF72 domain-containing protein [Nitrososphaerota archaeon]
MHLSVGCSGWSYSTWIGHFYPKGLESKNYLEYYSKVFDYVEIESSFYRIPNTLTTTRWSEITPRNFRFTAKFPKRITHIKRLDQVESDMEYFHKALTPLASKLGCLLIQLPPSMTMKEGLKKIQKLPFDKRFRYAIEARHKSWFDDEVYSFLRKNDICLAWSELEDIHINKLSKDKKLKNGFAPASNHYAGFAPATANMFMKLVGLKPVIWEEMKQSTLD